MDPPPLSVTVNYSDSVASSPRSRNADTWDDSLPSLSKLRLMCSYGGHIVPRPHDKSLCYVSGETRIVFADRNSSLADLSSRLSKTLLNGRPFTLKYQLPNEDLDSLISVSTDEDLENMIEEYDRTGNSSKPSRIRLFLFCLKPDLSQSIGPILDSSTKSDDWFLNALNGSGLLDRGSSDSANWLLALDDDANASNNFNNVVDASTREFGVAQPGSVVNSKNVKQQGHDVNSVPDSPLMESNSSYGSASSLANLPPIRVHVDDGVRMPDQKVGIEEQFAQMGFGAGHRQDEGFFGISSPPYAPTVATSISLSSDGVAGENYNRVLADDGSDHGVPVGYRKLPQQQPLHTVTQQKSSGGLELLSPNSVSSDGSFTNTASYGKPMFYHDQVVQKTNAPDQNAWIQIQQQVQDSGYMFHPQYVQQQQQQQQFTRPGTHYIQQHSSGPMHIPGYYPAYPSQHHHHHHQSHHQVDQQYPVYYVPARQVQGYNMNQPNMNQPNVSEAVNTIPSNRPQTTSTPAMVASPTSYNPTRNAPVAKPDMQYVQVPSSKHQQQYVGFSQVHHPSQSGATATTNYAYEFADPARAQIYNTQPLAPALSPQYQTMTAAAAAGLPDPSALLPNDNTKKQIRTSQPM